MVLLSIDNYRICREAERQNQVETDQEFAHSATEIYEENNVEDNEVEAIEEKKVEEGESTPVEEIQVKLEEIQLEEENIQVKEEKHIVEESISNGQEAGTVVHDEVVEHISELKNEEANQ